MLDAGQVVVLIFAVFTSTNTVHLHTNTIPQAMEKLPFLDDEQKDEENEALFENAKRTRRRGEHHESRRKERYWFLLLAITLSCFSAALASIVTNQWWHLHMGSVCLDQTTQNCGLIVILSNIEKLTMRSSRDE